MSRGRGWYCLWVGAWVAFSIVTLVLIGAAGHVASAQSTEPPPDYYASVPAGPDSAVRSALHAVIQAGHERQSYDVVWSILETSDAFGLDVGFVRTVYKNAEVPADSRPDGWNREHSWPKSYGFSDDGRCNFPFTDAHHLFPADPGYNSSRRNGIYDHCLDVAGAECVEKPVDGHPDTPNYRRQGTGEWEVWPGRRGDIARTMFYMDVRYEGGPHPTAGCGDEPDLVLTSELDRIVVTDSSPAYMGDLCSLLAWHVTDPVDDKERHRNHAIFQAQGNRNPFVDRPDWVGTLWDACPMEPVPELDPAPVYLPYAGKGG